MAWRILTTQIMRKVSQTTLRDPPSNSLACIHSQYFPHVDIAQRTHSTTSSNPDSNVALIKVFNFADVEKQLSVPSTKRALIDVREPEEVRQSGTIPGSLNIPYVSEPVAFSISDTEFTSRFGFNRPGRNVELIFFCHSGVRSLKAAELALKAGWSSVGNYSGSWVDWQKRNGKKQLV